MEFMNIRNNVIKFLNFYDTHMKIFIHEKICSKSRIVHHLTYKYVFLQSFNAHNSYLGMKRGERG